MPTAPRLPRTTNNPPPTNQPAQPPAQPLPNQPATQVQQQPAPEGYNLPIGPIAEGGRVAHQAMKQLGYVPTWGQNPRAVVEAYQIMKATPKDMTLPDWMRGQEQQIEQAYNWYQFRNKGAPPAEWKFLPPDDPGLDYLSGLKGPDVKPPEEIAFSTDEQVQQGQAAWTDMSPDDRKKILADPAFDITKYDAGMRDQILNDPAFDWSRIPKWQKTYFSIMSNPKIMASPMALAGAHAGGIFGLPGKLVGAAAGYGLGLVGGQQYDPTSGVLQQPTIVAGMMAVLNKLSEGAEQSAGFTAQYLDAAIAGAQGNEKAAQAASKMLFDPAYRKATWEAARITYEASDFLGARNWIPAVAMLLGDETATFAPGGTDFVIGSATPVDHAKARGFNPVTGNFYDVTDSMGILQEARLTIHQAIVNGEDPREVVRQIMGEESQYVGSQVSDFAGQMAIDPLEYLPNVTAKTTGMLARIAGNETAARAFLETSAPIEGLRRYKTLVQTGDVAPGFDYSHMGSVSRWAAGLNAEGKIAAGPFTQTGLLDRPTRTTGLLSRFKEDLAALTPEARAREGANMFYNNIGALLTTMTDPHEIGNFFRRVAKTDVRVAADLGNKIANAPEFYTILPALKAFDQEKLAGLLSAWELAAPKRDALLRVSDILGDSPGSLIEDLAKRGTTEQDFQRIVQRLEQADSPEARALLDDINQGRFTPDNLKDIVDAFSGDGALYWHPDQWKAAAMDALGSHFDEWTVDQLGLGKDTPESKAFFRTAHLLKSAQSVLLLGGSPGYALQNGLSGMVHRAATGIYGYMTPKQIDGWLDRFGVTPARLEEGVGIGGVVEQAASKSGVKTEAIQKAVKGNQNDALGKAQRAVSALGKAMPFNKLSSWFEKVEGKNGYMIAMRDMWSQTWRRGKGFSEMTPELRGQVQRAGINPNQIYNLIEAGMNKAEIEKFIFSRQQGMMSRTLVNDAAQKMGIPSSSAARLLEKVGVLDELDRQLANAGTPAQIRAAFRNAIAKAHDYQDMQTARDLKAMAEAVSNKVGSEGAPAALDVVQRVNGEYFDAWLDHYSRFGEMFDDLRNIPDEAVRNRAIDLNYRISDQEFRRINARTAANYQGIFAAWGKSRNPRAMEILAAVAQIDSSMKSAYDFMRNTRRQFFDQLRDNPAGLEPGRWEADQAAIDAEFDRAFKQKAQAEKQMGEALGKLYEEMHGKAAGEAARKWYEDYTKFSAEIVKREKDFRKSLIGLDKDAREQAKQRFYQTDKVAQIAELEKINQEGIARLERVIRRGGDGLSGRTTAPGTPPRSGPGSDEVNTLISDAEARLAEETRAKADRVSSVWDVAEEYNRVGLPYKRDVLQDRFALLGALRKEEYGGFPDLKGLDDERLTADKVRSILDERSKVKANEEAEKMEKALSSIPAPKITDNTNVLQAIKEHGGLSSDLAADLTGDTSRKTPGIFRKKGMQMDEMARLLADDGYPIDLNRPDDPGGIQQATDLLNRARQGEKVYPVGHDFEAAIRRQEEAYAILQAEESKVDATLWQRDLETAAETGDLTRIYEMFETVPEDGTAPTGESWTDYASRLADETAARVEAEARDQAVADMQSRIDTDTQAMEDAGDAAMTKRILEEKFQDVFDLTDEQAAAYMEISEAIAGWYTRATGESGDAFYSRYYEDVVQGGEGDLFQMDRPQDFKAYKEGEKVLDYEVAEQDFIEHEFQRDQRAARRNYEYVKKEMEKSAPPKRRAQLEYSLKHWQKIMDAAEIDDSTRQSKHEAYIKTVKEAIKHGESVPQAVIDQYSEFTKAADARARYDKGRHTSFANRSIAIDDSMQAQHGYKVKRQDGKKMPPEQIEEVRQITAEVEQVLGPLRDLFAATDLTIAHTNGKHPFLRGDAAGVYSPSERTVSVGTQPHPLLFALLGPKAEGITNAGAHELAHWLDFESGKRVNAETSIYFKSKKSEEVSSLAEADGRGGELIKRAQYLMKDTMEARRLFQEKYKGKLTDEQKKLVDEQRNQLSPYWNEPREIWARLVEQYIATKLGGGKHKSVASLEHYETGMARWDKKTFETLMPEIEKEINRRLEIMRGNAEVTANQVKFSQIGRSYGTEPQMFTASIGLTKRRPSVDIISRDEGQTWEVTKRRYDKDSGTWVYDSLSQGVMSIDAARQWAEDYLHTNHDVKIEQPTPPPTTVPEWIKPFTGKGEQLSLFQIEPINRQMTAQEIGDYARALVRSGADELRRAVVNEAAISDRIAILDAAHQLNPQLAENVARLIGDRLFQAGPGSAKGAVTFDPDGIRATIRAFESKDISTLVHENAHVFRRVLSDVASRTDNKQIRADLDTIEEWAGARDGNWTRDAEEKFARGFERYITEGKAPTPKLKRAFESFKTWMLQVYKQITGSQIDVKITDEVKEVFDRMLGEEKPEPKPKRKKAKQEAEAQPTARNWREGFDAEPDIFQRASLLRRIADISKSDQELHDVLERAKGGPEEGNIAWAVLNNPRASTETKRLAAQNEAMRAGTTDENIQGVLRRDTNTLFQSANPLGTMEDASGFKADSEWQDAGWKQHIRPLLDAMQETALEKLQNETPLDGAYKDMSPEGQKMLRQYIRQVQNDMGAVKNSTIKWGESQRDFALLNYNRRYGFDRYLETVAPYEFFATRSLMTWAMRGLDKPSWYANYARIRNAQNKHERDEPERLRNKFKIPAPWLPDWMGDALYIDPVGFLFTPANYLRPVERMKQDKTQQVLEAERVLQEWAADGTADEGQIAQASAEQSGALWERALAEASVRRESEISNPFDFMATLFGPAWYLSTPLNLAGIEVPGISKGKPEKVTGTPLLNTTRAVETVTKGTWAEPIGQLIGLLGKPEEALRKKAGLPEFGEFGDYYVDRQISNMVAEGLITPDQAQLAMIEREGELFDQARERVKMELAMRVPLAGAVYAGTHGGAGDAAKALLPSVFGAGLLPQGELEYRGLKGEWNAAWKLYDAGDKTAINTFFEEHPEYEAYLAKGKEPQERLRSYLIGNIWDAYMGLGATNQKAARAQMGEDFSRSFLDKETRSYDTLDVTTLTGWAQLLGAMVPKSFEGAPLDQIPAGQTSPPTQTNVTPQSLNLYDEQTTAITDRYFTERKEKFSDYFMLQQGYYSLPPSQRSGYLLKFPRLKEYFDWQKKYYNDYPELKPIFQGKTFKTVDTSNWPPALEEYVAVYAMTGQRIPKGAMTSLEQIWIKEGRPMDDLKTWINSEVVPAFLYQQGATQ